MTDVVIDLDRPDPGPPAARPPLRLPRPTPRQVRVMLLVVAVLVATFGVSTSGSPRPARFAGPVRIPGTGADEFLLGQSMVAVNYNNGQRVYGYDLAGNLKWATALPLARASLAAVTDDLVLLTAPMWPGRTTALDAATGTVRWIVDGLFQTVVNGVVTVRIATSNEPGPFGSVGADQVTVGLEAGTGRERWRTPTPASSDRPEVPVFGAEYRLVGWLRVGADRTGELLDLNTGQWRTLVDVPDPPVDRVAATRSDGTVVYGRYQGAQVVGDRLVVYPHIPADSGAGELDPAQNRVVAYGPDSPRPGWTASAGGGTYAFGCGPWLCLTEGDKTRVLDPATGAELRRVGWPHVIAGSAERFLGYDFAGMAATTQVAVFDAGTGRVLSSHVGWLLVSTRFAPWVPIIRRGTGLSWRLATLSLDTGVAYPLGNFDASGERACQNVAAHVACAIRSGEMMVWRLNPR